MKCAPARRRLGSSVASVGRYDIPALAGFDLDETLSYWHPDERIHEDDWISYTDPTWRRLRTKMTSVWGLAILLVHGPLVAEDIDETVDSLIRSNLKNARTAGVTPLAAGRLERIQAPWRRVLHTEGADGALYAWAVPTGSEV